MVKTWQVLFTLLLFHKVTKSSTESEITSEKSVITEEKYTSCSSGWFQFGDMCYKLGGKKKIGKLSWTKASEKCREEYNGNLVAIHSRELNDFITAYLVLNVRESVWIGLHDRVNESAYTWDDGSATTYLQWEPWEPWEGARESEDCVELGFRFKPGWTTGNWNDANCDDKLQFVCQKEKGKFSKRNSDPRFCSSDDGGGWKLETSCFNFVPEKKSWAEAEEYCVQKYKGHLVAIPDFAVNLFLNYILRDKVEDLWIGYRFKNERQKQWSSGWQVAFENWAEGEDEFNERSCVARDPGGKWVTRSCTNMLPFVCEYSTATIPTLITRAEGTSCPELPAGWRDLGGDYCYYFDLGRKTYTWFEANFLCLRRGSTLVSIHSQEEATMLHHFIKYAEDAIHIGLYRSELHDDEFEWADGSPVEIELWDANEPNTEKERCVEMRVHNYKWNDVECKKERGYICSIPKDFSNQTTEIQAPQETCLSGFSSKVLIGVIFCVLVVAILIGVVVYYFRPCERRYERAKKTSGNKLQSPSAMDLKPRYRTEMIVTDDVYENMI